MKISKSFFLFTTLLAILTFTQVIDAAQDGSAFDDELNERDFDALRDFLKTRKAVDIGEKITNLVISGDIRTEWRHMNESCKGKQMRGGGATDLKGRPISRNDFDIEFNLYTNFVYNEVTWAVAQVRYDNSAGVDDNDHPCFPPNKPGEGCCKEQAIKCYGDPAGYHGSGVCDKLCLKKAYMGFNVYRNCGIAIDIELGRRGNLYNVFDSNVQFLSRFDGILVQYDHEIEDIIEFYLHAAGFVVDERVNHFAWVAELGFMNIYDTNFDIKYSIIDWEKHGTNRCHVRNPRGFRFINSQWLMAYHLDPEVMGKAVKFYGAYLINHAARKILSGNHYVKKNIAWYAGVLMGRVKKEGDWAVEVQYQVVEAQSVPDGDCSGICRGNVLDESFTTCSRRGNTNFKGWKLEGLYAITDHMTIDTIVEWSEAEDHNIGGRHNYSKLELEAIYAF